MITNLTRRTIVADRGVVARSLWRRLSGLLVRRSLDHGEALVFPRCRAIHTWFMQFAIDVVFVRAGRVIKLVQHLEPFRFTWVKGADTVIELPAGTAERLMLQTGDVLAISDLTREG